MARTKVPKKNIGVNPPSPLTSTSPASSDRLVQPVATAPARPAIEPESAEVTKAEPFHSASSKPASFQPASSPSVSAKPQPVEAEAAKPELTKTGVSSVPKSDSRKTAGRPEIVKNEARANLVPINVEEEIRRLAYLFSERRGFEAGHETEDWLRAEREIRERYHQQSA